MQTVTYKTYTITRLDSGTINVLKDGNIISPTRPVLREIAYELNVSIVNTKGNTHITRQLGVLVMRAIEKQSNPSLQADEKSAKIKTINDNPCNEEYKNKVSHTSFFDKIKQTISKIQNSSISKVEVLIEDYFHENKYGTFYLNKGERIETVMTAHNVPNNYGVYIIYSIKDSQEALIYIGKAGTVATNGGFKQQGIYNRLKAVTTNNMQRSKYFQQEVIQKYGFDKLKFVWIVTFDDRRKELPAYSEAKLMQGYYEDYHKLPLLNRSF